MAEITFWLKVNKCNAKSTCIAFTSGDFIHHMPSQKALRICYLNNLTKSDYSQRSHLRLPQIEAIWMVHSLRMFLFKDLKRIKNTESHEKSLAFVYSVHSSILQLFGFYFTYPK